MPPAQKTPARRAPRDKDTSEEEEQASPPSAPLFNVDSPPLGPSNKVCTTSERQVSVVYNSISSMPEYAHLSFEELRYRHVSGATPVTTLEELQAREREANQRAKEANQKAKDANQRAKDANQRADEAQRETIELKRRLCEVTKDNEAMQVIMKIRYADNLQALKKRLVDTEDKCAKREAAHTGLQSRYKELLYCCIQDRRTIELSCEDDTRTVFVHENVAQSFPDLLDLKTLPDGRRVGRLPCTASALVTFQFFASVWFDADLRKSFWKYLDDCENRDLRLREWLRVHATSKDVSGLQKILGAIVSDECDNATCMAALVEVRHEEVPPVVQEARKRCRELLFSRYTREALKSTDASFSKCGALEFYDVHEAVQTLVADSNICVHGTASLDVDPLAFKEHVNIKLNGTVIHASLSSNAANGPSFFVKAVGTVRRHTCISAKLSIGYASHKHLLIEIPVHVVSSQGWGFVNVSSWPKVLTPFLQDGKIRLHVDVRTHSTRLQTDLLCRWARENFHKYGFSERASQLEDDCDDYDDDSDDEDDDKQATLRFYASIRFYHKHVDLTRYSSVFDILCTSLSFRLGRSDCLTSPGIRDHYVPVEFLRIAVEKWQAMTQECALPLLTRWARLASTSDVLSVAMVCRYLEKLSMDELEHAVSHGAFSRLRHFAHVRKLVESSLQLRTDGTYDDDAPVELKCPITLQVMVDPVITMDGHTYDRVAIERYLEISLTSPMTGMPLVDDTLVPNWSLKKILENHNAAKPPLSQTQRDAIMKRLFPFPVTAKLSIGFFGRVCLTLTPPERGTVSSKRRHQGVPDDSEASNHVDKASKC